MKDYVCPKAELITFEGGKVLTVSICNCYAERWNYDEVDWDNCTLTTGDFSEVGDANSGL